jgi:signal transduction histidine kinase
MLENPLGVRSLGPVLSTVLIGTISGLAVLATVILAAAFVSLAVRYRSGGREVRQQIKWIALAAVAVAGCQAAALLAIAITGDASNPVMVTAYVVIPVTVLFGIPAIITLAILKHGLYQIDVIINRAVQYGLLSAALTGVYAGIVVGIGTLAGYAGGPVLTVAAAVTIAVLFQPVRQRARLVANRLVYGQRATPYQVLADFAEDMAGQLDFDTALDRMASILAGATGAVRVEIWIRVGAQLRPQVIWPRGSAPPAAVPLADGGRLPAFAATRSAAVRHGDELLGALTVHKPRNEPISAAEDKLLQHLASQAGLVLRNVRLTDELRATIDDLRESRLRLVQAQVEERQRLERNLHDGAQQQLIALAIQLSLLEDVAHDPGDVRGMTDQLRSGLQAALEAGRARPLAARGRASLGIRRDDVRGSAPSRVGAVQVGCPRGPVGAVPRQDDRRTGVSPGPVRGQRPMNGVDLPVSALADGPGGVLPATGLRHGDRRRRDRGPARPSRRFPQVLQTPAALRSVQAVGLVMAGFVVMGLPALRMPRLVASIVTAMAVGVMGLSWRVVGHPQVLAREDQIRVPDLRTVRVVDPLPFPRVSVDPPRDARQRVAGPDGVDVGHPVCLDHGRVEMSLDHLRRRWRPVRRD